MVSLSTNEMLHQMVENYGYGSYLFSLLNMDQLERLQQIDPEFDEYIEDLMTDKIFDPEAKNIFLNKYKNDLWIHLPSLYELEIDEKFWKEISKVEDQELFVARLYLWVNQELGLQTDNQDENHPVENFKKGDVCWIYSPSKELQGYYILDDKFRNVFIEYKNHWSRIDPVSASFDILGNTPANFWQEIQIPELYFQMPMIQIFDLIHWTKQNIKGQNYLLGQFKYQKKKSKVYIPLPSKFTQEAKKLAISLQVKSMNVFYPNDPQGVIPSDPNTIFGILGEGEIMIDNFEDEEIISTL